MLPPDDPRSTVPTAPTVTYPPSPLPSSDDTATSARSEMSEPSIASTTATAGHSPTPTHTPPPLDPHKYPGYELLEWVADGGMGKVYRARELALGRIVALKELKLNVFDAASARHRFANEQRTMASIEHLNLVPIYFSGEHNGAPFYTMKFMPGGTLPTGRTGWRYPPTQAAETLRAIADGVSALHARGVVHRDLKPSNILLDDAGVPHVADFGLAKWLDEDDHTQTGLRNGTPPYMSPEQVAGRSKKLTSTCDVWAIGVVGYELLSGRRPFEDDDREELFRQIREDAPPPLSGLPESAAPLVGIVLRCLRKNPLDRYPSAAEVRDLLTRFLAGEHIEVTPEPVTPTQSDTTVTAEPTPEPPRVSRRTILRTALGIGGLATLGGGGYLLSRVIQPETPPTPPVPPPIKSFAELAVEDLKAGQTVELIGKNGKPKWSAMVPPNCLEEMASPDGTYTFRPNKFGPKLQPCGWLELFAEPIPVPYRVECEVCYREPAPKQGGHAALYLGRRTWESKTGSWQTMALLKHLPPAPPGVELAAMELWANPVKDDTFQSRVSMMNPWLFPAGRQQLNRWVSLSLELRDDVLTGTCDGQTLKPKPPYNGPKLPRQMAKDVPVAYMGLPIPADDRPTAPDFAAAPTLFGPGLGVFVLNAAVSIRTVRLVPLPPAQER